ncbi:helix-turn-helix transcriptional regulator [Haloechinothrix sp. LS1_15]|uniref:helix-turn-helix domain-containing protein n=1 Tax=Haloechinothrix sp. LS1_15 TaxID=2652248 RepID=UPI0029465150|nr:helix-turn-helix transcriptional regulator [Haloechinothrix sp. LS1_15]MDV6012421.1 helix-turn-helix domain-containing protein [Haloechinothrix sp. LS1_15]
MREPTNELSATLRRLRKDAGLSGAEAARRAGLSQPKVSRTETGTFMPTPEQVDALCQVYDAPTEVRKGLVGMAREVQEDRISARIVLERGGWRLQERIGRIEEVAGRVRSVAPTLVPGLLQTRGYAEALFGESLTHDDRQRTVDARMMRQRLLDTQREFTFVLTEGALWWNMGGARVMSQQLAYLDEVSRRDNVRLGVIPWSTPVTVPVLHAFDLYDSRAVLFGTQTATALVTESREVTDYEAHWAELQPFVSYGDDARAILERITAVYQNAG